jgi:hypothetical protein
MEIPFSFAALYTPAAISSLYVKTAVGSGSFQKAPEPPRNHPPQRFLAGFDKRSFKSNSGTASASLYPTSRLALGGKFLGPLSSRFFCGPALSGNGWRRTPPFYCRYIPSGICRFSLIASPKNPIGVSLSMISFQSSGSRVWTDKDDPVDSFLFVQRDAV